MDKETRNLVDAIRTHANTLLNEKSVTLLTEGANKIEALEKLLKDLSEKDE